MRRAAQAAVAVGAAGAGFDGSQQVRAGPHAFARWRFGAGDAGGAGEAESGLGAACRRLAEADATVNEARGAVVQGLEQLRAQAGPKALVLYGPGGAGREVLAGDVAAAGANCLRLDAPPPRSPLAGLDWRPGTLAYRLYYAAHYAGRETDAVRDALETSQEDWVLRGVHPQRHAEIVQTATQRRSGGGEGVTVLSVDAPVLDALRLPEQGPVAVIRVGDPSSEAAKASRTAAFRSALKELAGDGESSAKAGGTSGRDLALGGTSDRDGLTPTATAAEQEGDEDEDEDEIVLLVQDKLGLRLRDLGAAMASDCETAEKAADMVISAYAAELRELFGPENEKLDDQAKTWLWDVMKLLSGCEVVTLVGASHLSTAHEEGAPLRSLPTLEYVGPGTPPRLADATTSKLGDLVEVRESTSAPGQPTMAHVRKPVAAAFKSLFEEDGGVYATMTRLQKRVHLAQDLHKLAEDLRAFFTRQAVYDEQVDNLLQLVLTADDPDDEEILHIRIDLEAEKLKMGKTRGLLLRRLAELRAAHDEVEGEGAEGASGLET